MGKIFMVDRRKKQREEPRASRLNQTMGAGTARKEQSTMKHLGSGDLEIGVAKMVEL